MAMFPQKSTASRSESEEHRLWGEGTWEILGIWEFEGALG